jgi:hypothetical protein
MAKVIQDSDGASPSPPSPSPGRSSGAADPAKRRDRHGPTLGRRPDASATGLTGCPARLVVGPLGPPGPSSGSPRGAFLWRVPLGILWRTSPANSVPGSPAYLLPLQQARSRPSRSRHVQPQAQEERSARTRVPRCRQVTLTGRQVRNRKTLTSSPDDRTDAQVGARYDAHRVVVCWGRVSHQCPERG